MRKQYIDFLRLLALFYMFFQHGVLTLLKNYTNPVIIFLNELVPICPALFLFLCGLSITIHFEKKDYIIVDNNFFSHLIKRGFILIIASMVLFFIEFGFQIPDILFSSSILNTIGWFLIISAIILRSNKYLLNIIILSSLLFIQIIFFYFSTKYNIFIYPLTYAYEPIIPTITFGFIGLLSGLILFKYKDNLKARNIFVGVIGITGLIILAYFFAEQGAFKIFYNDVGRYEIIRSFNENLMPENLFNKNYGANVIEEYLWNFGFGCFIASIGAVFILFSVFYFLEDVILNKLPENIFLPGRNQESVFFP